jgi:hypothetical protein
LLPLLLLFLWQEESNRRANQDKLGQLGLLPLLAKLGADAGGAPAAAVRAQVRAGQTAGSGTWQTVDLKESVWLQMG